jgi:hypothetical protein
MDLNECLKELREIVATTITDRHPNLDAAAGAAYRTAELFERLDRGIRQQGRVPEDWRPQGRVDDWKG